jgi:hypothetical protein
MPKCARGKKRILAVFLKSPLFRVQRLPPPPQYLLVQVTETSSHKLENLDDNEETHEEPAFKQHINGKRRAGNLPDKKKLMRNSTDSFWLRKQAQTAQAEADRMACSPPEGLLGYPDLHGLALHLLRMLHNLLAEL